MTMPPDFEARLAENRADAEWVMARLRMLRNDPESMPEWRKTPEGRMARAEWRELLPLRWEGDQA